jgi:hypothetical protein
MVTQVVDLCMLVVALVLIVLVLEGRRVNHMVAVVALKMVAQLV